MLLYRLARYKSRKAYIVKWVDTGVLLHLQPMGETKSLATLFTQHHGNITGCLRTLKKNPLHIGCTYSLSATARLDTHLPFLTLEPLTNRLIPFLQVQKSRSALLALHIQFLLIKKCFAEKDPHPNFYNLFCTNLITLCTTKDIKYYALFELFLLKEIGIELNLSECAVTGTHHELTHVSPKTGRAVCQKVAAPYLNRLFILPQFLIKNEQKPSKNDIKNSLNLTGFFLEKYFLNTVHTNLPKERSMLIETLS